MRAPECRHLSRRPLKQRTSAFEQRAAPSIPIAAAFPSGQVEQPNTFYCRRSADEKHSAPLAILRPVE